MTHNSSKLPLQKRRRLVESAAILGIILIAVALISPFADLTSTAYLVYFKWVYAAGALIYTFARAVDVSDPAESKRLKRMRRLEFWAGTAFVIAAAFWFYNDSHMVSNPYMGALSILRDTITFSLVGAVIQVVASWMIYNRAKKEGF